MGTLKSMMAIRKINESVKNGISSGVEFVDARINHNSDLEQKSIPIVFNEKCIKKILESCNEVVNSRTEERGTFFYGRIINDMMIFDTYKSDFELADGVFENGAVSMENCLPELEEMTKPSKNNSKPYNVVMHFHVHPSYVLVKNSEGNYEEIDVNYRSLLLSDQDYLAYEWLDNTQQYNPEGKTIFLGGLLSVNYGIKPNFTCVTYVDEKETFINFTNIYYIINDKVFRFNRFNISNSKLTNEESCHKIIDSIKAYNKNHDNKVII